MNAVAIVGGGPSLAGTLDEIRELNAPVWACNGAYPYLVEHGIEPQAFVMVDRRKENAAFVRKPVPGCVHYLDKRVHPDVVRALKHHKVKEYDQYRLLAGGTVVSHAMLLARQQGLTDQHFFGVDCCYMDGDGHAYPQPWQKGEKVEDLEMYGKTWRTAPWMLAQVADFNKIEARFHDLKFTVHGNGLWARSREEA